MCMQIKIHDFVHSDSLNLVYHESFEDREGCGSKEDNF